jgi:CoA:oxalate CoA-transferase
VGDPISQGQSSGPLADVTVLDLTQHLAGPFASQILGDLGARIIKVEPPAGDSTRHIGPYFVDEESAYYLSANRNKESVCIDLKTQGGQDALLALVARADIVLENFRPGTLDKLGIGYETLSSVNEKVVVCSISGFGQDGPYRDRPAFDMIVQALSGGMSLTGEADGLPVRSGLPIGDLCAGMYGVIGALAGLARVAAGGPGSYVDVAMLDTQVSLLSYVASYYLTGGAIPGRQGREHMSIPTYRAFTCLDGQDIVVAANTQRMWVGLCAALDVPALADDERFTDNNARQRNRAVLDPQLGAAAAQWEAAVLLERLREAGVPCAPLNDVGDALADPQVRHRGMVLELPFGGTTVSAVGNPVKISEPRQGHRPPPHLGEHTVSVLREVAGMTDDEIDELIQASAVVALSSDGSGADGATAHKYGGRRPMRGTAAAEPV